MSLFGFSRANHITTCNGKVMNSAITTSTIDMNGGVITTHGSPINGTDVVNKDYVDNITVSGIPVITITLTGTAYTTILANQTGSIMLLVKNIITNGPSATFILSKSEAARQPSTFRLTSCDGLTTEEKLDVRWQPSTGIELKKTGLGYNGTYYVKYIHI